MHTDLPRLIRRIGAFLWAVLAAQAAIAGTADHSKFDELKGPFASGEEVTRVCLKCHTEAARQVMATRHWVWEYVNPDTGQKLGKKTMLNGFCIGDRSNEAFCQACHIGYGWRDASFDFRAPDKVDCLACHNTGGYTKPPGLAGHPAYERTEYPPGSGKFLEPVDLVAAARHVGRSSRNTCGACHYYGGGGDGVKHGDLDSSLNTASRALDVHMAKDGLDFSCSSCHKADAHAIAGSRIQMSAADAHGPLMRGAKEARNPATCQSCHGDKPHREGLLHVGRLNAHSDKLACQSCHIPQFARGGVATKMSWDWSAAGRLTTEGKPFQEKDEHGHVVYDSRKGAFTLGENVVPDYVWFNGKVSYTLQGDRIDPSGPVAINTFHGGPADPDARIWPVKRFRSNQPYDIEHRTLLVPHTAVPDDSAYWYNFDWAKALAAGAAATGAPFSGQYGFVRTEMLWPITHMVAPKEDVVACAQCHSAGGRLQGIGGIYLPGQHRNAVLDWIGWLAALGTLAAVIVHGAARIVLSRKKAR